MENVILKSEIENSNEIEEEKEDTKRKVGGKMISNATIEKVKEISVEELLEFYDIEIVNGKSLCMFHDDNDPSLVINFKESNLCHCFACNETYNGIQIAQKLTGKGFKTIVEDLSNAFNIPIIYNNTSDKELEKMRLEKELNELREKIKDYFVEKLYSNEGKLALEYLRGRNLTDEIIREKEYGFAPKSYKKDLLELCKGFDLDVLVKNHILNAVDKENITEDNVFPFFNNQFIKPVYFQHRVVGFQGGLLQEERIRQKEERDKLKKSNINGMDNEELKIKVSKHRAKYHTGIPNGLLLGNADAIKKGTSVLLLEGDIDATTVEMANIKGLVPVSIFGTNAVDKFNFNILNKADVIYLALDSDEAGQKANEKIAGKFKSKAKFVEFNYNPVVDKKDKIKRSFIKDNEAKDISAIFHVMKALNRNTALKELKKFIEESIENSYTSLDVKVKEWDSIKDDIAKMLELKKLIKYSIEYFNNDSFSINGFREILRKEYKVSVKLFDKALKEIQNEENKLTLVEEKELTEDDYDRILMLHEYILQYDLNEIGVANRFVDKYKDDYRFDVDHENWYVWDGVRWKQDIIKTYHEKVVKTLEEMMEIAKEFKELSEEYGQETFENLSSINYAHVNKSSNARTINAILEIARNNRYLKETSNTFDTDDYLVATLNGYVDLKTGELLNPDKDKKITKQIPHNYNKEAKCPRWEQFLNEIFVDNERKTDKELVKYVQKVMGLSITGSIATDDVFFFFGDGSNGKSTFVNSVRNVVGREYSMTTSPKIATTDKSINKEEMLSNFVNVRALYSSESGESARLDEAMIKQIAGGEEVHARALHKAGFSYLPKFNLFFSTNHKPYISGTDKGIWRRIKLIPFLNQFSKEDEGFDYNLEDKLKKESEGILNWLVEGAKIAIKEIEEKNFIVPTIVSDAVKEYQDSSDTVQDFLEDCFEIDVNPSMSDDVETISDIYNAYIEWCDECGIKYKMIRKNLIEKIEKKNFPRKKIAKGIGIRGLKIKNDFDDLF